MKLELNTVKPGAKKAYIVGTSFMLRDRQGYGDEQSGENFAFGTLSEAEKMATQLKLSFDKPWTESRGSHTVGFHNDVSIRKAIASDDMDFDPSDDRTWADQEDVLFWSNENKIPW